MSRYGKMAIAIILLISSGVLIFTPLGPIITYRLNPSFPKIQTEELKLAGLTQKVSVYFDDYGVPHIEAQNLADLVRATGFVHARYRFFQLDVLRRFASGRISELVGDQKALSSSTVEFDLAMRGWGFSERVKIDLSVLPEVDQQIITAFSDGINQGMQTYPSIEHRILGVTPEPWQYEDTLLVSLLQAWSITHNWEQEAVKLALALNLGSEMSEKIYPQDPLYSEGTLDRQTSKRSLPPGIVPEMKSFLKEIVGTIVSTTNATDYALGDTLELKPSASNAWVVGGTRSLSGMPILSNDMHLTHALPSMLFLQHLKMPGLNIIGTTMPGLPFLINGYNGFVAWGSTSAVADVVDLVVEKEDLSRPGFVLNESKDCAITHNEITIKVKGESERKFNLRRTCNGHVFNDMYPNFFPKNAPLVSLRFEIPNVQESFGHLLRANQAKTIYELRDHLMKIPNPIQNITAADQDGNFGFFTTGSVPLRDHHRGTFAIPGWLKKYEWSGWTKALDMPAGFNPSTGMLVNGNNLVHDPLKNWPIFHVEAAPNYRYAQIKERLLKKDKHTQDSVMAIQTDVYLKRAELILPSLLQDLGVISSFNEIEHQALMQLQKWDLKSDGDSIGTSIFFALYRKAILLALNNKVSESTVHAFVKQRYSTNVADQWFLEMDHPIWDNPETKEIIEKRSDIILQAYRMSINDLVKNLGPDPLKWQWGKLHTIQPRHLFGSKKILDFFNLKKIPLAGSLDSVWKAHFNLSEQQEPFKTVAGPVTRLIIDMGKPEEAMYSIDTGQSGWPLDPHYSDQYEKWQKGELIPMVRNMDQIKEKFSDRVLSLVP
jgi:penicillin G amidase